MNPITTFIACAINGLLVMAAYELWECGKRWLAVSLIFPFICVGFTLGVIGARMMS